MSITGEDRGIGAATVRLAAQSGYAVAVSYLRHREETETVVCEISEHGGIALAIAADISKGSEVEGLFVTVDK